MMTALLEAPVVIHCRAMAHEHCQELVLTFGSPDLATTIIAIHAAMAEKGWVSRGGLDITNRCPSTNPTSNSSNASLCRLSSDDKIKVREDLGLTTLIDLHDQIMDQGGGYWIKIEAWKVEISSEIPHGMRYSLTLHEPYGKRILGYDNAHGVKPPKKFKYAGTRLPYDHKHPTGCDKGVPYEFKDAYQLLSDFFAEADRVLKEDRKP